MVFSSPAGHLFVSYMSYTQSPFSTPVAAQKSPFELKAFITPLSLFGCLNHNKVTTVLAEIPTTRKQALSTSHLRHLADTEHTALLEARL